MRILSESRTAVGVSTIGIERDIEGCLESVLTNTHVSIPVVVVDDGMWEDGIRKIAVEVGRDVMVWRETGASPPAATVNKLFQMAPLADVVIVDAGVVVGRDWLEGLRTAAYGSSNVATATALSNEGFVTIDRLVAPSGSAGQALGVPIGLTVAEVARRVAITSRRTWRVVPRACGVCSYIRRSAVDVVGTFDESCPTRRSAFDDFSQRAVAHGLIHVCADDVFVYRRESAGLVSPVVVEGVAKEGAVLVDDKEPSDPTYPSWANDDVRSPAAGPLLVAQAALRGMRVIVDGTRLVADTMGTQVVVLESIRALSRHSDVADLSVVVLEGTPARVLEKVQEWGGKVLVSRAPESEWRGQRDADIVYRPCQVTSKAELEWLLGLARRVVVCQLDCIAYNNPAYFANWTRWSIYRRANELAFRFADGIAFLSEASRCDAVASGLLPSGAAAVVYAGTDPVPAPDAQSAPRGIKASARGFFLCVGASYRHKNRLDALRIWAAARARGWTGDLVLAGPTPPQGNSLADEGDFLCDHPELRSHVWQLGALSIAEREWLYERAALVLYPTLSEGFGLIPFEAALRGVPCLSTRAGGLDEVLPRDIPTIDIGNIDNAASLALEVAQEASLAESICRSLNARAAELTWARTANSLVSLFWEVLGQSSMERARVAELGRMGGAIVEKRQKDARAFHRWVASSVERIVERPRLRRGLVPPGSARYRMGAAAVRFVDRRQRQ